MLRPGEIYMVDTLAGKRPAVIVSRAELNRGRWVVVVLITSSHFGTRSALPHCVPFQTGEFGLVKNCVAQAETITFVDISDLDADLGVIGCLDDSRMRDLIRAVGNMLGSDCEPL